MTHVRPIFLLCLICNVVGFSLLNSSASPVRARGLRAAAPHFPYRVSGVKKVAQLIGPTPKSPYAPSAHSINDTTKWSICSGDLGSLMYLAGTAYITLGDNYKSCPPGTGGPGGGLNPPNWRSNAVGVIPHPADFTHGRVEGSAVALRRRAVAAHLADVLEGRGGDLLVGGVALRPA